MANFKISAPGRIVLFGELGAMYRKHVILASLNRRTTLEFCEIPYEKGIIKIDFPDVDLSLNVSLNEVVKFLPVDNEIFRNIIVNHTQFLKLLQSLITFNGMWRTHEQRISLEIFFFLLMHTSFYEHLDIKSFHVRVFTELPIGAGLGSSSSFAVCLAACFLRWSRLQRDVHYKFNNEELQQISAYAALAEKVVQNRVHETDNDICTYGNVTESRYYNQEDIYYSRTINVPIINILLVDLKIQSNTGERAIKLAEQKYFYPEKVDTYLDLCDKISKNIFVTLYFIKKVHGHINSFYYKKEAYTRLQIFFRLYTIIQSELNMFHPRLIYMDLSSLNYEEEYIGKFAGYEGNFAYFLLPPDISEEQITNLSVFLTAEGFDVIMTSVSCKGVTID